MSRLVPQALQQTLLERIAREADKVDWDHLPQAEKSAALARWIETPEIGGVLKPLLGGDADVRVWLKEVVLKKRSRRLQPDAETVAACLFPNGTKVDPRTIGIKPHHCVMETESGRHYVCWGAQTNAKHLFWAALNAEFDEADMADPYVVIVERGASVTPPDRRARYEALAKRCGLRIAWIGS